MRSTGTWSSGSRRAWRGVVAAMVVGLLVHVCSAYFDVGLRRGSAVEDWLQIALIASGGVLCGLRAMWVRGERAAWALIGAGLVAFALGNSAYAALLRAWGEVPTPSLADVGWLSFYGLEWLGFVLLVRAQVARFYWSMWLDGLIAGAGVGAFAAAVIVDPVLRATHGPVLLVAINLAYPLGDLLLLTLVAAVAALTGARPGRAWLLLGASLCVFVVADSLYLFQTAAGTYVDGGGLDSLWALASLGIGVAAWQPTARREVRLTGWAVIAVPCTFFVLSLGLLVYATITRLDPLAVALAALALLCTGARAALTFHETRELDRTRREALSDDLTGLANRRHLRRALEAALEHPAQRQALILLDLDGFKELNDTLGHDAGDRLLQAVARRLARALPDDALLARLGGDEFAALLPVDTVDSGARAADALRAALGRPIQLEEISLVLTAGFGLALAPDHGQAPETLLQRADVAMYQAKRAGGGCVVYEPGRDGHSRERLSLAGELRDAIPRGELELHYQPKADLATGAVCGVEALVRWRHPQRGLLMPSVFVPIAEQTGLMRALTRAVLEQAVAQAARWRRAGRPLPVAVNLFPQDLLDLDFPSMVLAVLDRQAVPAELLQVELTEQTLMSDPERAGVVLGQLGRLGIERALDDFGTGYSSLAYLQRLHVDELKVDRSFVADMTEDATSAAIVRSILDLAGSLGLRTVAEGVETPAVREQLRALGCQQHQGYLLSRPLPADEFDVWLTAPPRADVTPAVPSPRSTRVRSHAGA